MRYIEYMVKIKEGDPLSVEHLKHTLEEKLNLVLFYLKASTKLS